MQALASTIAENLGKNVPYTHKLAPKDSQFSLEQVPDLTGKVALVTGGSEGVGYGCAHTLLAHNISKLFILSKSADIADGAIKSIRDEMGHDVANRIEWIECDLNDWEKTANTAFDIRKKTERLDIVIHNAGRGIMTQQFNKYGVDMHLAQNHFGPVILNSHLLPLLKKTAEKDKVRIVTLGSNAHEQAPKDTKFESLDELNKDCGPMGLYGRSKLATMLYAKYLARHVTPAHPNILANTCHPGVVETRQSTEHIHEPYPWLGYGVSHAMAPFKKTQFEGAVSTMFAATTTEKSGQYIAPPAIVEKGSELANNDALGEQLMSLTRKIIKEKTYEQSAARGCPFKDC